MSYNSRNRTVARWRTFLDAKLVELFGKIAGIGGLSLGVLLILFRAFIKRAPFPKEPQLGYRLIRLFLILIFSIATFGIGAWVYTSVPVAQPPSQAETSPATAPQSARIRSAGETGKDETAVGPKTRSTERLAQDEVLSRSLSITYPPRDNYAPVDELTRVSIRYNDVPLSDKIWLVVQGQEKDARYWPLGNCAKNGHSIIEPRTKISGPWEGEIHIGSPTLLGDRGQEFKLVLAAVSEDEDNRLAAVHRGLNCPVDNDAKTDGTVVPLDALFFPARVERLIKRKP